MFILYSKNFHLTLKGCAYLFNIRCPKMLTKKSAKEKHSLVCEKYKDKYFFKT